MKETIKCSISGVAFTLDADAYEALKGYLDTLRKNYKESPDGAEIVADIEARIAELILSAQDHARVVEKPLVLNIIAQMGAPEDIADAEVSTEYAPDGTPRIPRRLYRDTENAKLGGVCAGIAKYFDVDPVWVRLALFLPLMLMLFSAIPFMYWMASTMGNLFGIFVIGYLVMWFAVPEARTARQKLEMNGEKITAQSIHDTTTTCNDADSKAKPIVAEAVSVLGKVVLVCLKIFLGILVFGLIMVAAGLFVGILAVAISGSAIVALGDISIWVPIFGILVALVPTGMLIYVFMCLIASRKPSGKAILIFFLLWLVTIIACVSMALHEGTGRKFIQRRNAVERIMQSTVVIDNDSTTVKELLEEGETGVVFDGSTLRINDSGEEVIIELEPMRMSVSVTEGAKKSDSVKDDKEE